jgi:hypothetical protein
MSALIEYVQNHTDRSVCRCGKCIDAGENKPVEKSQWDLVELVEPPHTVNQKQMADQMAGAGMVSILGKQS